MLYYRILCVAMEQRLKLWPDGPLLFVLFLCKFFLNKTLWEVLLSNKQLWDLLQKKYFIFQKECLTQTELV